MSRYSDTSFEGLIVTLLYFGQASFGRDSCCVLDIDILVKVVFDGEEFTTSLIKVVKRFGESCRINF